MNDYQFDSMATTNEYKKKIAKKTRGRDRLQRRAWLELELIKRTFSHVLRTFLCDKSMIKNKSPNRIYVYLYLYIYMY